MNSNPLLPKSSRQISTGYQTVIIAGLVILFFQLYSLAKSIFDNNMFQLRIEQSGIEHNDTRDSIKKKQLEYFASLLHTEQITEHKRTKGLVFADEGEHRIQNSEYLAHKELMAPSEDPIFQEERKKTSLKEVSSSKKMEELVQRRPFDQWMYVLFHIE